MRKISMKWPVRLETRRALLGAVLALPIAFAIVACGGDSSPPQTWTASWYGAPQAYNEPPLGANAAKSFQNQTFRQTMYVSQGGTGLRIRVSNLLGTSPLAVTSMRVARSAGESSIDAASDKAVTFGAAMAGQGFRLGAGRGQPDGYAEGRRKQASTKAHRQILIPSERYRPRPL